MKLLLTLIACCQLTCVALHVRYMSEETNKQKHKYIEQHASSDGHNTESSAQTPPRRVPWWKLPNTNNGEMNALTGPQLRPFPGDDSEQSSGYDVDNSDNSSICPVKPCQSSGALNKQDCGQHARCLQDFCRCDFGWKPAGDTWKARGWTGLEALTVWVDAYHAGCTERCDSLSCAEVPQMEDCFVNQVARQKNSGETTRDYADEEGLASDALHLGAIKAPGADGSL